MRRFLSLFLLTLLLLPQGVAWSHSGGSQTVADPQVAALLAEMGPEERVGQLSLVTFYGSDTGETSDIAELISRYHVGGVVLLAENDNFDDTGILSYQVHQLTTSLQRLAANSAQPVSSPSTPYIEDSPGPYIPLFIGLEHDGSGRPHTQLLSGVTPLPSSMAVGATWDTDLAEATGQTVGVELTALGINLLLGPSLDVVEKPLQPPSSGDLGTWVFGGETFWVSQMASAYVRGVHEGSDGRLAVVPRHFPGHGGADRLASVEVPTVRKSLEELKQFDLIPFFEVTDVSKKDPLEVADALMTGHISYRGFQGDNPLVATQPISLDNRALQELMKLEPLAAWRAQGGLIISDALGLRGVRRLYRQEETFSGRGIAKDALMAGNDILYLGQFGKNPLLDQKDAIIDTIDFFVQAYESDSAFQARVDDAVQRILRKKLDLYGGRFDLERTVLPASTGLSRLGSHSDVTFDVAQSSLTLLSPARTDLLTRPQSGERIVIFTDTRKIKQCASCTARSMIPGDALQSAILRLYGPQASKLVTSSNIQSYSFDQLANRLDVGPQVVTAEDEDATAVPDNLSLALNSADWVVFLMLDVDPTVPSSNAVKRFLAVSPVSPDTRIVVMAMAAPYYLDSTEVAYLTAYYGLYGYTEKFVDVAARALFRDVPIAGASPVSVGGVNYNIVQATSPDPNQIISLFYNEGDMQANGTPTPVPVLKKGDILRVSTGVIVDRNGNPVPDRTPVDFVLSYKNEGLSSSIPSTTLGGVAEAPPQSLDRIGELSIAVRAGNLAVQSETINIHVLETGDVSITVSSPDVPPTITPIPTVTPTVAPVETETPDTTPDPPIVNFGDLFMALFGLVAISITVFVLGLSRRDLNYGLLLSLPTIVLGLSSYNYYALYMPGARSWRVWMGDFWGAGVFTWLGALVGLALTMVALYTVKRLPRVPSGKRRRR